MSADLVGLPFFKLSGAGNDFVALADPAVDLDPAEAARILCRRGLSIGADGLFVLRRVGRDEVVMEHFNADGGAADLCLNGTRCAAALAFDLGWAGESVTLRTGAGSVCARRSEDGVRMRVVPPGPVHDLELLLDRGTRVRGWFCDSGVPHVICPVGPEDGFAGGALLDHDLAQVDVDGVGAAIRRHPDLAPHGANVNFLKTGERPSHGLRTFERGVEGETLACGTGALASAAVLRSQRPGASLFTFETRGGFILEVLVEDRDGETLWFLEGDARTVARGTVEAGALAGA